MFKHQKVLLIISTILTIAMTIYVCVTPAAYEEKQEAKSETESVIETESDTEETESQEDSLSETEADSDKETEEQIEESENRQDDLAEKDTSESNKNEVVSTPETNVQKPGNNSSSGNSDTPKPVTPQKPAETTKPVVPETQKPVEQPKPVEPQKPAETTKPVVPETQAHTHNWVAVTEQQDQGWYETGYEWILKWYCNTCGEDITSDPEGHVDSLMHGGYRSTYEQVATGQTWVPNIVEVIVGYTCSCGASK